MGEPVCLHHSWSCAGPPTVPKTPCPAGGEGPGSDKAAEKHAETAGHMTITSSRPEKR